MDALPYLVLENILLEIKRAKRGLLNDLLSCMLVCKTWHDTVAPLVYGAIALDNARFIAFTAGFNADRYARHVLSVTLRLNSNNSGVDLRIQAQPQADLARCLILFVPQLAAMRRLASFSFHATERSAIPSRIVVELLDCLPETCRAVEIKYIAHERFSGWSRSQHKGGNCEGLHVCEAVRRLLPQLAHVKLHMASICAGLFGLAASPVAMPNLRTMMINMSRETGIVNTCGEASAYSGRGRYPKTWIAFSRAMERAFEDSAYRGRQGLVAKVIGPAQGPVGSQTPTYVRANVLAKDAWVIPQRSGWDREAREYPETLQSPDGSEIICVYPTSDRLCEGEDGNWCSVVGGARLPREALLNDERGSTGSLRRLAELVGWCEGVDEECPLQRGYPPQGRLLRLSSPSYKVLIDTVAEIRLIGAVRRVGQDNYLSLESPRKQPVQTEDTTVEESEDEGDASEDEDDASESEDDETEPVNAGGGLLSWVTSLFTRS